MEGNMQIEETILIDCLAKVQADIELAIEKNNKDIIFESNNSIMSNVFLKLGTPINKDHWNQLVELYKKQKGK
jgi:sporulation-control protein spo0M